MRRPWPPALLVLLLLAPLAAAGGPAVEWATPEPGTYEVQRDGTFGIEVECTDDPEGDPVYVVYFSGGEAVDEERDYWGTSPSYRWQVGGPGEYAVAAACYDENGESAEPGGAQWRLVVPQPPQPSPPPQPEAPASTPAPPTAPPAPSECPPLDLALPPPAAESREGRRVQDLLLTVPVLLERPALVCAADEALAVAEVGLTLTTPFVETQETLEALGIGEHNAWNLLAGAVPALGTAATVVEVAHHALLVLYELSALGVEMNTVVEAVHAFLQAPSDQALAQVKGILEATLPLHHHAIAQVEAAARAVGALADPVRVLLADVPALRAEIDTWWVGKSVAHAAVDAWEQLLRFIIEQAEAAAAAVDSLADPIRERAAVMEAALHPPEEDTPGLPVAAFLALLALAVAVRRSRVRQH